VLPLLFRYVAIMIVLLFTVGPFLWLLSTSLKSAGENIFAYPPMFVPQQPTLDNFFRVV
jgi:ABC-type glycerol-3-phosphate transport system permease component